MPKEIEAEGKKYVIKTEAEWTLGDYAEVLDASALVDPTTLQMRQLMGTHMTMSIFKGVLEPKMRLDDVKRLPIGVSRVLYSAIMNELNVPLPETPA